MELKETPERIVEDKRIAEYGAFRTPFEEINMSEARIAVAGREMPGLYGRMRLKEWQHFGVVSDDFYFGFAIVDARYLGNSFCYFLDRNTGKMVEHDRIAPPGIAKVARELWEGVCHFRFFGYDIRVDNRLNESRHHLEVDIKGSTKNPSITAEIEVTEDLEKTQPLVLVSPLKGERPSYTHKVACPAEGEIKFGGMPYSFDRDTGVALIDVTKTFFPYNTFWNWATCAGHDSKGRQVALNLSKGISMREDDINDNCLWVDGKLSFLGVARFNLNPEAVLEPWRIEASSGKCNLEFEPQGERSGKINLGVIKSDFHQPYGTFRGTAVDSKGETHEIDNYFGVCEHHFARF
jgi:hypothetical protein